MLLIFYYRNGVCIRDEGPIKKNKLEWATARRTREMIIDSLTIFRNIDHVRSEKYSFSLEEVSCEYHACIFYYYPELEVTNVYNTYYIYT